MDVQVTSASAYSRRAAVAWNEDGARFHVWFNIDTKALDSDQRIYKNPPNGVDHTHPDYFRTRYLDASNAKNVEIIKHVFAEVDRRGLVALALADEAEKERKRIADNDERARLNRIEEAALALYDACVAAEAVLVDGMHVVVHAQLRAAIAKAKGQA